MFVNVPPEGKCICDAIGSVETVGSGKSSFLMCIVLGSGNGGLGWTLNERLCVSSFEIMESIKSPKSLFFCLYSASHSRKCHDIGEYALEWACSFPAWDISTAVNTAHKDPMIPRFLSLHGLGVEAGLSDISGAIGTPIMLVVMAVAEIKNVRQSAKGAPDWHCFRKLFVAGIKELRLLPFRSPTLDVSPVRKRYIIAISHELGEIVEKKAPLAKKRLAESMFENAAELFSAEYGTNLRALLSKVCSHRSISFASALRGFRAKRARSSLKSGSSNASLNCSSVSGLSLKA